MGKVGETVKFGWERHPRRGTVGPPQERDGRPIPMYHHLFTLGKCVYLFRIHSPDTGSADPSSIEQAQKLAELAQAVRLPTPFQRRERRNARSDGGP
jgi:hypothetical protein